MICKIFDSKLPKVFLMVLTLSEKAKKLTIDANGKLYQWLWKPNFLRTTTRKLSPIVKLLTMKHPMRILLWIKRLNVLKKQISTVNHPFFRSRTEQDTEIDNWHLRFDNILVNQENDSVLKTLNSWISKSKLSTKDVKSRQRKSVLGYANQFETLFVDKETQLVCRKSKHSPKQICLARNGFMEAFKAAHDHCLSGHPGSEKLFLSLKRFFYWPGMYKWVRTLTKSCLTCRKIKKIRKDQNNAPNEK